MDYEILVSGYVTSSKHVFTRHVRSSVSMVSTRAASLSAHYIRFGTVHLSSNTRETRRLKTRTGTALVSAYGQTFFLQSQQVAGSSLKLLLRPGQLSNSRLVLK